MAFLALGDVVAGALYQSGAFTRGMTVYVWGILAGSAVGLLASTMGRLYASTYYALHDTRTPLRFAVLRVALTIGLGYLFALPLPRALGLDPRWGAAGLTASAGIAGWIEFLLLQARAEPADRGGRPARGMGGPALGRRRRRGRGGVGPAPGGPGPPTRAVGHRAAGAVRSGVFFHHRSAAHSRGRRGHPAALAAGTRGRAERLVASPESP